MPLGLALWGTLAFLWAGGPAASANYADTFRIRLVDQDGNAVPFRVEEFRASSHGGGLNLARAFKGGEIRRLTSGTYRYRLIPDSPHIQTPVEGKVAVAGPPYGRNSLLVAETKADLDASIADFGPVTIVGTVSGLLPQAFRQTWVTLVDPYSGESLRQAPLDEQGRFVIDGVRQGNFVLVVCQSPGVVAAQPVLLDAEHFEPGIGYRSDIAVPRIGGPNKVLSKPAPIAMKPAAGHLTRIGVGALAILCGLAIFLWARKRTA